MLIQALVGLSRHDFTTKSGAVTRKMPGAPGPCFWDLGFSIKTIGYQTLVDQALRQHVEGRAPQLEEALRRILREEIKAVS